MVKRPSWQKRLVLLVGIWEDMGEAGLPGVPEAARRQLPLAFVLWAWPGFGAEGAGVVAAWFLRARCPRPGPLDLSTCLFYLPRVDLISINPFSLCVRAHASRYSTQWLLLGSLPPSLCSPCPILEAGMGQRSGPG